MRDRNNTTWRELMTNGHWDNNRITDEQVDALVVAPNKEVLEVGFDSGFGGSEGPHFLAWSKTHVYFPVVYDGAESVGSAPRNPQDEGQEHVGGE